MTGEQTRNIFARINVEAMNINEFRFAREESAARMQHVTPAQSAGVAIFFLPLARKLSRESERPELPSPGRDAW